MSSEVGIREMQFEKYRSVASHFHAKAWMTWQWNRGLAANTLDAYGRGLEKYLLFLASRGAAVETATRLDVATYIRHASSQAFPARRAMETGACAVPANATLQQRATVIRLFHDYLVEEGVRDRNPVRQSAVETAGTANRRGLVPRHVKLPWIPNDDQWRAVLEAARQESVRNRLMLAMAYDCGLRREELCHVETGDLDPAYRLLRIRAEHAKGRRERVIPYSETTAELYVQYLQHRWSQSHSRGRLFLSESRRNRAQPLSIWTWSKVIEDLADRSGVRTFTTHTPRHLCLTDLARANWDIHEIAAFAGHRSIQTTLLYIHLSGRELAQKLAKGMAEMHARRLQLIAMVLK